jgi:hypothetical protein
MRRKANTTRQGNQFDFVICHHILGESMKKLLFNFTEKQFKVTGNSSLVKEY